MKLENMAYFSKKGSDINWKLMTSYNHSHLNWEKCANERFGSSALFSVFTDMGFYGI